MGKITDAAKSWLRKYLIDGVSGSGENNPDKDEGMALFKLIEQTIGVVHPIGFGAKFDGETDDTDAFNAAFVYAKANNIALVSAAGFKTARIDGNITWDINYVGFDGAGIKLDGSQRGAGSGAMLAPTTSGYNTLPNAIRNIYAQGPGAGVGNCRFLDISMSSLRIEGCLILDFASDFCWTVTSSFLIAQNCTISHTINDGTEAGYSVDYASGLSSDMENNRFINCIWTGRAKLVNNWQAETTFQNCSFDGGLAPRAFVNSLGGTIKFLNCHHEWDAADDSDYMYINENYGSHMIFDGGLILWVGRTVHELIWNDTDYGEVFIGGSIGLDQTGSGPFAALCGGPGVVRLGDVHKVFWYDPYVIAPAANQFAHGDFESDNWTGEWTKTGTTDAVKSSDHAHSGTYSLKAAWTHTVQYDAYFPAKPGCIASLEAWAMTTGVTGSSGIIALVLEFADLGKHSLTGYRNVISINNTDVASWTRYSSGTSSNAPPGTAYVHVQFYATGPGFGDVTGSPVVYLDDIVLNLH